MIKGTSPYFKNSKHSSRQAAVNVLENIYRETELPGRAISGPCSLEANCLGYKWSKILIYNHKYNICFLNDVVYGQRAVHIFSNVISYPTVSHLFIFQILFHLPIFKRIWFPQWFWNLGVQSMPTKCWAQFSYRTSDSPQFKFYPVIHQQEFTCIIYTKLWEESLVIRSWRFHLGTCIPASKTESQCISFLKNVEVYAKWILIVSKWTFSDI